MRRKYAAQIREGILCARLEAGAWLMRTPGMPMLTIRAFMHERARLAERKEK